MHMMTYDLAYEREFFILLPASSRLLDYLTSLDVSAFIPFPSSGDRSLCIPPIWNYLVYIYTSYIPFPFRFSQRGKQEERAEE